MCQTHISATVKSMSIKETKSSVHRIRCTSTVPEQQIRGKLFMMRVWVIQKYHQFLIPLSYLLRDCCVLQPLDRIIIIRLIKRALTTF